MQLVNKPTHRGGNILDIILTNQPNITNISVLSALPCSLKSDHFIINFDITSTPTHKATENHKSYPIYNYDKADWDAMNDYLINFNFQTYFNSSDVNFLWESLKSVIFDCINLFVPKVLHKPHSHPIWFTPEIKHKLNQIHSLRRKYRAHPTPNNMTKLSISEAHLQSIMSSAKLSYENSLVNKLTSSNSNKIYKYIASLSKQSAIPSCMYYGSRISQSCSETAQLFNEYFYSVYNKSTSYPTTVSVETSRRLGHINMSPQDVWASLL